MTREEIVAFLARRQAAVDRHDAHAMAAFHAEHSVLERVMAGKVTGREAITKVYEAWFKAFPNVVMPADEVIIDGDRVALVNTVAGSDTGGFMGLPPSGRPFRLPLVQLYTVKDGEIHHARSIYDFTGMLLQIGVLKAKPA